MRDGVLWCGDGLLDGAVGWTAGPVASLPGDVMWREREWCAVAPQTTAEVRLLTEWLRSMSRFSRVILGRPLHRYQLEIAQAITESVLRGEGRTFVVIMPRQAGKNEISAQVEAYLLARHARMGGQIVKASPTYLPQAINSLLRLEALLRHPLLRGEVRHPQEYIYELGRARALFFSAHPGANVVGATADLLLEGDEAQDLPSAKWDKDFAPMAASTNATRVLYGTAWTSRTLLAREWRAQQEAERRDGARRVFVVPWERVAEEVPAYGAYVAGEIARLGATHPLIRTQYLLQEIDAIAGMFPPARQAQMRGDHPAEDAAQPDGLYAMLLDVAGEDEAAGDWLDAGGALRHPRRDYTALTVVRVDASSVRELGYPTYRVVHRRRWTGVRHALLYGALLDLARHVWRASYLVVDATGVGAGLASFLGQALPGRVVPYLFNVATKSELGWGFLSLVDVGRFKDHAARDDELQRAFWREVDACRYEIHPGPGRVMRWGVEEADIHDDLLISVSLCWVLDRLPWRYDTTSHLIEAPDVL